MTFFRSLQIEFYRAGESLLSGLILNQKFLVNIYDESSSLLKVVDGSVVEVDSLRNIPTSQVKSVDVLKGASASARYGSRGMNGVIVIQTKSQN